jgi:transposase
MSLREQIAYLEAQNALQAQETQFLAQKVISLESKVLQLLELLQKQGIKKDSHNSSKPPSSDTFGKQKSLRKPSERKSGGQEGHEGKTLEMRQTPDKIIDLTSDFCSICGQSLAGELQVLQAKRQVIEIPPIVPIYEEYRQYSCACPRCKHLQKADFPAGVNANIQYGSSVVALMSYFSVYQYVAFRRLRDLFAQVFHLPLSEGSIGNMLEKASKKCAVVFETIKTEISQSKAVGSDETGAKVNGAKWWIWVWQTVLNTLIVATDNRSYKSIQSVFKAGLQEAILISDRWAAQLKTQVKGNQICLAHLLRELNFLEESEKHTFASDFKTFLADIFVRKKDLIVNQIALSPDDQEAIELENSLNQILVLPIDQQKYPQTYIFQNSMLKYRNYLLPCLYNLDVPPDNNASERAIRNIKVKQKVSGQFKSGQNFFCTIRSVIDTLRKRKLQLLPTLQAICKLEVG